MARASDKQAVLYENLCDAGCDSQTIEQCVSMVGNHQQEELLRILAGKRSELMDEIHMAQKRVDCLDFLVYQIGRGNIL